MKALLRACGVVTSLALLSLAAAKPEIDWTRKHEEGRCAIRGQCGKQGWFGSELPCPDNGLAEEPDTRTREKLVDVCGDKWSEGPVCCEEEQVVTLSWIEYYHKAHIPLA